METIKVKTIIDEKRRIMIDLPDDVPLGEVELEMNIRRVGAVPDEPPEIITREWVRAKLKAAGLLAEDEFFPEAEEVSEEELERLGRVFAADGPISELVDEDREERF
jgi:hypothetical protein